MRLHRLVGIIMLLNEKENVKAKELASILETSERTIYRDIDILCEAGIPVVSIPGPTGGFSFMEGYKINSETLCSSDILNLLLSTMGIGAEKNTDTEQELKNVAIKLENSVPIQYRNEIKNARERFFCDNEPWFWEKREVRYIDTIKKAVLNLKKLKITYKKYNGDATERIIRPYGAIVKNSEWYLAAFCETRNEIRIFRCSRINYLELLDETFSMPKDFFLEDFWKNSKQKFMSKAFKSTETSAYPVRIKLFNDEKALRGFTVISVINKNEFMMKTIDMLSFETACTILFPLSDRVEVLEPYEVRNFILKKAKEITNFYNIK